MTQPDLASALAAAAAGLEGAVARPAGAGTEWELGGRVFAAIDADVAEFRLAPVVGRAALGTPDTGPSGRGPEWIAFRPRELDRIALDRAVAWLGSAWRHAGGG